MRYTLRGTIIGIMDDGRDDWIGLTVRTDQTSHGFAVPLSEAAGMQLRDAVLITVADAKPSEAATDNQPEVQILQQAHENLVVLSKRFNDVAFSGHDEINILRREYKTAQQTFHAALCALTGVEDEDQVALDDF